MPPRDVGPGVKTGGNSIATLASGVRRVAARVPQRKPPPPVAPARSPVLGPLNRQTTPQTLARQGQQNVQRIQRQIPAAPKRNPSLPPPKPRPGTPLGAFQANEPLAPILRARTQANVNVAKDFGYQGSRSRLGQIGAQTQYGADALPVENHAKHGLMGLLATAAPAGAIFHVGSQLASGHVPSLGDIASIAPGFGVLNRAIGNTVQATVTHPAAVLGHTVTGLGSVIAGTPAGIAELATGTFSSHPLAPWERLAKATAADVSRRYGPLVTGNDKAFRDRLVKEGLAPELLDATAVLGGGAAVAGRAAGRLAATGALGERAARLATEARPLLRISGNTAVAQELHPNLLRNLAQRGQDRARQLMLDRRNAAHPGERPGLQPQRGEVVPFSPRLAERRQRIAVSQTAAQSYIGNRREQTTQINQGLQRDLAGLSRPQRRATWHVAQGLLPVHHLEGETHAEFVQRFRQAIAAQKQRIIGHRQAAGTPEDPAVLAPTRELQTLAFLDKHAEQVLSNDQLARFHGSYLNRMRAVAHADPGVRNETALLHPYRVQGDRLGVAYEPEVRGNAIATAEHQALKGVTDPADQARIRQHFDQRRAELAAATPVLDRQFIDRVRQQAKAAGLPEPAYVMHGKRPVFSRADRTAANLFRAVGGARQSDLKLLREGRADTSPQWLIQSVAKGIKRKFQWQGVATAADQHAFHQFGTGTPDQLRARLESAGVNANDFAYYNPGRLLNHQGTPGEAAMLHHAFDNAAVPNEKLNTASAEFRNSPGFVAIPKGVYDELSASTRPAGKGLRLVGRAQGIQSAAILGLNPSWLSMQVAANTLQSGFGMHGNLKDILTGQKWYRDLPADQKEALDVAGGVGLFESSAGQPHLGIHQGKMSAAAERLGQVPLARLRNGTAVRLTDVNPIHAMFRADNAQNNLFRRAVIYNDVKRRAFRNMQSELGQAQTAQARVSQMLRLKPGESLSQHMDAVLSNPRQIEALGQHVNNVLGDYLRYTSRERKFFRPYVMFYGFLRYALKTLFYTLPVKHPLATALAAKVGQLHDDEIRQIFGTRDVPPWVFSRLFQYQPDGSVKRDGQGRPLSIDLARINPVTTPVTDAVQESSSKGGTVLSPALGMISPVFQAALDQAYARNSFTGQGFHVGGNAEDNPAPDLLTRGRIVANDVLSSAFPYREAMKVLYRGKQGDEALLGFPAPIQFKTAGTQAKEAQREALLPSRGRQLAQDLLPLVVAKSDTTGDYLAQQGHQGKTSPLEQKYGLGKSTSVDTLAKKYGLNSGPSVDSLAAKYGVGK